jgi:phosphatidylinositol alpha-1,6-mannosyltransferase
MRLLYLTTGCFDKGGVSRYSRYQVQAWRDLLGPESVRVLSVLGPDEGGFEEPFSVTWFAGGRRRLGNARFSVRTAREIMLWRPEMIHSAHLHLSGLACALAPLASAATMLNVYGLEVWSGLRADRRWGLRNTQHVVSDCHFTARYLEDSALRPRESTAVIWDCVDPERFSPGEPDRTVLARYNIPDPATSVNLISLGRMSRASAHKGYERLLEVFGRVAREAPALRLVYAGRGDLVDSLRARAAEMGLAERVFFAGSIHDDDLVHVYRAAQIFSLVSDRGVGRGEGIPLTPLEAAACGVPILVGNNDGSQEAVVEGVNGHAIDPFDLDRHSRLVLALVRDKARRREMGRQARARVLAEFAYAVFKERHRQLLTSRLDWRADCFGTRRETQRGVA